MQRVCAAAIAAGVMFLYATGAEAQQRPLVTEDPETIVLRQQRGLRRAFRADTVEAGFVGACDGDLTVVQILDALSTLLERHRDEVRSEYLPRVAELLGDGFLEPVDTPPSATDVGVHHRGG